MLIPKIFKEDLFYKDFYSWSVVNQDNPSFIGSPDNDLLNRHEGYEMLSIINKIFQTYKLHNKKFVKIIETLIRDHLPSNIRSRDQVIKWFQEIVEDSKMHR